MYASVLVAATSQYFYKIQNLYNIFTPSIYSVTDANIPQALDMIFTASRSFTKLHTSRVISDVNINLCKCIAHEKNLRSTVKIKDYIG
jgi:hypothetical protein